MKVSLANLLLLINQKESEVSENYNNIMKNSAIIKDKELDGNETSLNEVEDFKYLQEKYEASAKDLELYKNKLAYINATEKISLNMTIIEAINKVSILAVATLVIPEPAEVLNGTCRLSPRFQSLASNTSIG